MPAFDIPGLDFFDTTGKAPNSFISCRKFKTNILKSMSMFRIKITKTILWRDTLHYLTKVSNLFPYV